MIQSQPQDPSPGDRPAPPSVAHIGLAVPDIEAATAWYVDTLGFTLLGDVAEIVGDDSPEGRAPAAVFGPEFERARVVHLAGANGTCLELFEFVQPRTVVRDRPSRYWDAGFSHLCLVARDVQAMVDRVERAGGRKRTDAWPTFVDDVYRFAHCEDPWGNAIEFYSHPHEQAHANRG